MAFRLLKRLVKYDYLSPLDIETCKERLDPKYRHKQMKEGVSRKDRWNGWFTGISINEKKNRIDITTSRGRGYFSYHFTLEKSDEGTILHCRHNPVFSTGLPSLLFLGFIPIVAIIIAVENLFNYANPLSTSLILPILVISVLFSPLSAYLFFTSRSAVSKLLHQVVEAEMIKQEK